MKFGRFFNDNNVNCALSNIAHGYKYATPVDVYDAIEDSRNSKELLENLRALKFVGWYYINIDRETKEYIRIIGMDMHGNVHYMKVWK